MTVQEVILSDFRSLCRYTREHEGFKSLPKSLLTKHWPESDEEYRNFLCDALKYYFTEKDYRKIMREEIKLDEEAKLFHNKVQSEAVVETILQEAPQNEVQPESVKEETNGFLVDNTKEIKFTNCTTLTTLL